jgi:polyisoprenyl-phosphate glycosyltransferase
MAHYYLQRVMAPGKGRHMTISIINDGVVKASMQGQTQHRPDLTIIVPVYNSAAIFPELYKRMAAAFDQTTPDFEIVAVLDGCRDNSYDVISAIAERDKRLIVLELSRNFGHQAALTAGLEHASGEIVAIIDDDLEDPPELIPRFIEKLREGYQVVYGIRRKRERSLTHRILYKIFYRISGFLSDIKIPNDAGDFCVMEGRVARILSMMPENNRYLRGMRAWTGFRQTGFEYDREHRFASESGYTLTKYFALAFDGIFAFSYKPLKYVTIIGVISAIISFTLVIYVVFVRLTGRMPNVPGWASLAVMVLFLSGVQFVAMGIIGEYIARIYDEVKQRPKYLINKSVNLGHGENKHE